jgi:dephospho-CoA kinase
MNKPYTVGITGGIGAGKSLICHMFEVLGVPVYDADSRAKWLMDHDPQLKISIESMFGKSAYDNKGLDRTYMAGQVFNNVAKLEQLNAAVHPVVNHDFEHWYAHSNSHYVVKEAALLIETGSYKSLDRLLYVSAPEEMRLARVLKRDPQRNEQQVRAIMDKQLPEIDKIALANDIIYNDETTLITPQIVTLHHEFLDIKKGNA